MHKNRINNSYEEYQQILIDRWESTLFWFAKKEKENIIFTLQNLHPRSRGYPGSHVKNTIKDYLVD